MIRLIHVVAFTVMAGTVGAFADQMGPVPHEVLRRHAKEAARDRGACDRDDAAACDRLGRLYLDAVWSADPPDGAGARAQQLFERACKLGSVAGCTDLAAALADGLVKRDMPRAIELDTRSCDAGDLTACTQLADIYNNGKQLTGIEPDRARARRLYERVCTSGKIAGLGCNSGCNELADWAHYGNAELGIAEDRAKAASYEDLACTAGCINSCDRLGDYYRDGEGVPNDYAAAAAVYQRGCDAGFAPSCLQLGMLYLHGKGVAKDAAKMKHAFAEACRTSRGQVEECKSDATAKTLLATLAHCDDANADPWFCNSVLALARFGTISGTVVRDRKPVAGAWFSVDGLDHSARTDARGVFTLTGVPAGHHRVASSDKGHWVAHEVDVAAGEQTRVAIELP